MKFKNILLIISGSIAGYKALELIRLLKQKNYQIDCVLTNSAKQFVTPLSVQSLTGTIIYDDMFAASMPHIKLSRDHDLILVAPASANIIAKTAHGIADDLATTLLLARDKPAIFVPAMNTKMWENKATIRNVNQLLADGIRIISPTEGSLACGEFGLGKMAEPEVVVAYIEGEWV